MIRWVKTIGWVVLVSLCAWSFGATTSPSWSDLGLMKSNMWGGTTCWVPGTQWCPAGSPACEFRYECEWTYVFPIYYYYRCTAGSGDQVHLAYPPKAEQKAEPGKNDITSIPNMLCARHYECEEGCVDDPVWGHACQSAWGAGGTPITTTETYPSTLSGDCSPEEE